MAELAGRYSSYKHGERFSPKTRSFLLKLLIKIISKYRVMSVYISPSSKIAKYYTIELIRIIFRNKYANFVVVLQKDMTKSREHHGPIRFHRFSQVHPLLSTSVF